MSEAPDLSDQIACAAEQVAYLRAQLDPARRLRLEQGLAYWEAALDSLEDDGVMPYPKGQE